MRRRLSPARFAHVCAVRASARDLALKYGCVPDEAELAGLLHDYARELPDSELLRLGAARGLISNPIERRAPVLLHGPVGAYLVQEELEIFNPRVLEAITLHTLGGPDMGLLAKVIYLADLIADGRNFPDLDSLRRMVWDDLDRALLFGFACSIRYCLEKGYLLHPRTLAAWNYYLREGNKFD